MSVSALATVTFLPVLIFLILKNLQLKLNVTSSGHDVIGQFAIVMEMSSQSASLSQ